MFENEVDIGKNQYHELREMIAWCKEQFGAGGYLKDQESQWFLETAFGNSVFYFKQGSHATAFALKWK